MVQKHYRSDYPNQVHMLQITPSRHIYITQEGWLRYQKKRIEINLEKLTSSTKEHLVNYIIGDHCSGAFYAESHSSKKMPPVEEFLYRAWKKKDYYFFCGMPEILFIPKTVEKFFPYLSSFVSNFGIASCKPSSGFQSGVRSIRTWEELLWEYMDSYYPNGFTVKEIEDHALQVLKRANNEFSRGNRKEYLSTVENLRFPPDSSDYLKMSDIRSIKINLDYDLPDIPFPEIDVEKNLHGKAQDLIDKAWETPDPVISVKLAKMALSLFPNHADGYVILANETRTQEEKIRLYKEGIDAGESYLKEYFSEGSEGIIYSSLVARPYMRAREGLAVCLWKDGRKEEAETHFEDMLRLNPNDNNGVRYILAPWLIESDRDEEAGILLEQYKNDGSLVWAYSYALWTFRRSGDCKQSQNYLLKAIDSNKYLPDYLLGRKTLPEEIPDSYSWGEETEAQCYFKYIAPSWETTPDALKWLNKPVL